MASLSERLAVLAARSSEPRVARDLEVIRLQLTSAERKVLDKARGGVFPASTIVLAGGEE